MAPPATVTSATPAARPPRNTLAWLSLGLCLLGLLAQNAGVLLLTHSPSGMDIGTVLQVASACSGLLILAALGLALLALDRDRDRERLSAGLALGASGMQMLSTVLGFLWLHLG